MSDKGTRKGRLYGEKTKKMATTEINFNVHGKLSEEKERQLWPIFTLRRGRNKKR